MCFGPFTKICHWGPLTALGIIKCVTGMAVHCSSMWWPPATCGGLLNTICFMSLAGLTLYNFLSAISHGPGYLPLKWKPSNEDDISQLQFCGVCQGYKAPRSHHCRKCGRCVMKMDHHCPWINNCVGWGNHAHFTAFLFFAVLGCTQATIILSCSLYRAFNRVWYLYYGTGQEPIVHLGLYGIIMCVLSLGLAAGVVLAVGMLLFFQVRAILRNRTGIEDWIIEKANHRRKNTESIFIFPYDLGTWKNIKQVMNISCQPIGDGITWELIEGCDQYTLTREQIEQKNNKRQRTKVYRILRASSGAWIPISHGCGVCIHPPYTDEPRIKLAVGDTVLVTRWRKYWLFGEKVQEDLLPDEESLARIRGWFPRRCAVELVEELNQNFTEKKVK
ncbi:DHHC palmitoyltransferase [Popillia japonica]|uniref:Palmitoyltransferase n=1 Tax=Popillia japonica TaxID=7064 RepID=A0AAW1KN66_POPJA